MEPQRLIDQPVCTDDYRGRDVGRLEEPAPRRDQLTVTGEHDCLGRTRGDVHRDVPTTVVLERLGDELSCNRVGSRRLRRCFGDGCLVIHRGASILDSRHSMPRPELRSGLYGNAIQAPGWAPTA